MILVTKEKTQLAVTNVSKIRSTSRNLTACVSTPPKF